MSAPEQLRGGDVKHRGVFYLSIIVGVCLWSTIEVVSISAHRAADVTPAELTFCRFFFGGLVVLPFGITHARRSGFRPGWRFFGACFLLGVLAVPLCMWLFQLSLTYLKNASSAAALFCGHPLFVALIAPALLGERLTKRIVVGMLIGLAGVLVVSLGQWRADAGSAAGIGLMLAAGALFALYTVLLKTFHRRGATILAFCVSSIMGSAVILAAMSSQASLEGLVGRVRPAVWQLAFLALFSTGLGYLSYFWGMCHVPASSGTTFIYLKPIIAAGLAMIFLGERLRVTLVVGIALVVAGVALAVVRKKRPERAAASEEG